MIKFPRQQWKLRLQRIVHKQFRALSWEQKQGVFDAVRKLLEADNPYSVPGVKSWKAWRSGGFVPGIIV